MSVSIKYKGAEIASASTETTKTIKTAGKYCEADILVENTPDSGGAPVINPLSVTANGTYTAPSGVDGYSPVTVNVPQGITPTGNINITDTNVTDVTNYATAQVVDADLVAENIKKDVNILGVVGSFEGGGGGEEVYFSATGNMYTKNMVVPDVAEKYYWTQSHFYRATEMETIEMLGTMSSAVGSLRSCFYGCTKLKSIKLTNFTGVVASTQMVVNCPLLESIQFGSVGHPISQISIGTFSQMNHAFVITVYVAAETLAEVVNTLTDYQPWGAPNATVIYRSSTTGEVLT